MKRRVKKVSVSCYTLINLSAVVLVKADLHGTIFAYNCRM